jgi:hypothetical protein
VKLLSPDIEAAYATLEQRREENKALILSLAQLGAQVDAGSVLNLRISCLLDLLFPRTEKRGQRKQIEFELSVEKQLSANLTQMVQQVRRSRLTAGTTVPPDQVAAMARMAQSFKAPGAEQPGG